MNPRIFNSLFLLGSLLLLLSCGGDGGDNDAVAVAGADADGGALKGHIRVQDRAEELVLPSRQYRQIPAVEEWIREQKQEGDEAEPYSRFSADGRFILQIQPDNDCEAEDLDTLSMYCFTVFDENYSTLGKFALNIEDVPGTSVSAKLTGASLSQDGQYVAIVRYIQTKKTWQLKIYDLSGDKVSAHESAKVKNIGEPVWLTDGSLVLTIDNTIVRTDPYSTLDSAIKRFPAGEAEPSHITVSHDGKQLLFLRSDNELWAVRLDGSNLHQVVKLSASHSDSWKLSPGAWSPDDGWIAFRVVLTGPGGATPTPSELPAAGPNSILLAVPSNATNAIATNVQNISERSPEVVAIKSYYKEKLTDAFFTPFVPLNYLVWVAK
jgi:hypothetical protein